MFVEARKGLKNHNIVFLFLQTFPFLGTLLLNVHSHRSGPLPSSWEYLRGLTPTEVRGCGGYQRHTMTLDC